MATKRKKRKKRGGGGPRKGGVMMGMRSGFKSAARSVGVGEDGKPQKKSSKGRNLLGTAVTVVLVAVAAYVLYTRFG